MVDRYSKKDPFIERETEKYEHPVPSREFIIHYLEEIDSPASFTHLVEKFELDTPEEREGLRRRLNAMERDGQLIPNRRGKYGLVDKMELVPGRVTGHKDGFGFLKPDDGSEDIFLTERQMRSVFPGDRVLVRIAGIGQRNRREGVIVEVLERNTQQIVGRYYEEGGVAFIDPDNKTITQDIIITAGEGIKAKHGQFVVVEIIAQPSLRRQPMGKIIEVLGDTFTPGMEVELSIRSYGLPYTWSENIAEETKYLPKVVKDTDIQGRRDLRPFSFVTIDGEDAKDFDDAVYIEKEPDGWKLFVAIADVSHYVKPNTSLDDEAKLRGTSVYFPSRVIPMLPEVLSNELCSLKPNVDRLVTVCEMKVNREGLLQKFRLDEAVIHSQARLTYTEVAAMVESESSEKYGSLLPMLKQFHLLYKQLLRQRDLRGSIEFDTIETRIIFGEEGKIKKIIPVTRNDAHRMIEEAMLLANLAVAEYLEKAKIPTLYRVHEGPDEIKVEALRDFLKAFGLRLSGGKKPTAMDYSKLLHTIDKREDAHLLQTVMLRSLRQAIYSPNNTGHFGLAYESYCHFTSPIRRYPDLVVHRAIKHLLQKKKVNAFVYDLPTIEKLGEHCSTTERRADQATRDAVDWLKCEYMLDKVGQEFEGIISGVTGFGIFVELKDIFVEGLLHITALVNDYYHHDPASYLLRGKNSGKTYRLGDPIRVLVARVDQDKREIDFDLTDKKEIAPQKKKKSRSKSKSKKKFSSRKKKG